MTAMEFALRLLNRLRPLAPGLIAAVAATVAAAAVLYLLVRHAWMGDKRFGLAGLFFGLRGRERFRLACIWVRLVFVVVYVVSFQALDMLHYAMILLPGILSSLTDVGLVKKIEDLFWLVLQLTGLLAVNMVCRFVQEMSGGWIFIMIYVGAAAFLVLFSLFLFISDLGGISQQRSVDPYEIWAPETKPEPQEGE